MKAAVYLEPGKMELREIPDPEPKENEVKLKIRACGICGSDIQGYLGVTGRRIGPMIMGHEFAGEVVAKGNAVKKLNIGDRVCCFPLDFCGECDMCRKGMFHLCENERPFGVLTENGAFAEFLCVPEKVCFLLEDHVSYAEGSLMEPLTVAASGVEHLGEIKGKDVAIIGAGTIGLMAVSACKLKHPKRIFVVNRNQHRLSLAGQLGGDVLICSEKIDPVEKIMSLTEGKGVATSVEAVGITDTVKKSLDVLAFGGKSVWIGLNAKQIDVEMQKIVCRELCVYGTFRLSYQMFGQMVQALNKGELDVKPLLSKQVTLEELPHMFQTLSHGAGDWVKVTMIN
ncbi:MAG: alcohol dehydrogenase catalytic domain-containing protein [Clostridiales bacterium]|nr:alcohol dehydrogenase catalytic domain-containing protein [Clostridiales bacterium]